MRDGIQYTVYYQVLVPSSVWGCWPLLFYFSSSSSLPEIDAILREIINFFLFLFSGEFRGLNRAMDRSSLVIDFGPSPTKKLTRYTEKHIKLTFLVESLDSPRDA